MILPPNVVYNHFGRTGTISRLTPKCLFSDDITTQWGGAIDFRRPEIRRILRREGALMDDGISLRRPAPSTPCTPSRKPTCRRDGGRGERNSRGPGSHVNLVPSIDGQLSAHLRATSTRNGTMMRIIVMHATCLSGQREAIFRNIAVRSDRNDGPSTRPRLQTAQGEATGLSPGKPRGSPTTTSHPLPFVLFAARTLTRFANGP